jgi:hypothetical protein
MGRSSIQIQKTREGDAQKPLEKKIVGAPGPYLSIEDSGAFFKFTLT